MLPIIDAHHHLWDLGANRHPWLQEDPPPAFRYGDTRPLRRNYLPADYRRDAEGQNVVGTVYMEAEHDPTDPLRETRWVHRIAASHGLPQAMAGAAFLDRSDAAAVIRAQAAMPLVRSLRHKPKGVARPQDYDPAHRIPGSLRCPAWRAGYRHLADSGLHFELQTPWWHLPDALELARDFPGTLVVLNHLGLPADRSAAGLAGWRDAMARLAEAPNIRVKLSGIGVPGQAWTPDSQAPVVLEAVRLFGAERCMVASNFPVDGLVAGFGTIMGGMRAILAALPEAAQRRILAGTATETYRISL
ncbi:amidohydrolase family protein [Paracraurococcus ruber]|uniref:Thioesterase n=1 Tax=Paracraurococcus ruber TaxID=77675 RepID=A0ABS1CSS2_9PROT|nr:amidohydrolase family protein [Paracraurococcus ruber]MBK1657393.1 thioesterase [Paracraurococcus ruber]TDG32411.1 thioesterase [Paracraurococcus ruber]